MNVFLSIMAAFVSECNVIVAYDYAHFVVTLVVNTFKKGNYCENCVFAEYYYRHNMHQFGIKRNIYAMWDRNQKAEKMCFVGLCVLKDFSK